MKIIVFLVVIFIIYMVFFKKRIPAQSGKKDNNIDSDIMIECCECGTFVSQSDVIIKDGKYYCSKECANKLH